jgi:hypothetical protein
MHSYGSPLFPSRKESSPLVAKAVALKGWRLLFCAFFNGGNLGTKVCRHSQSGKMQDVVSRDGGLYERILGTSWKRLPEVVRDAHRETSRGVFCVIRGPSRLAQALAGALRLPTSQANTPIVLQIAPCHGGERWRRTFGTRRLTTRQYEAPNGLLAERFGALEFRFRLGVIDGRLIYCQEGAFLCVGSLRIPLPHWISPQVSAAETAAAPQRTHVSVSVSMPGIGRLIAYEGDLEIPSRSA